MSNGIRPTVVSLFTGAGGLDLGLETAGFRVVAAVECDEDCVATLRTNQQETIPIPSGLDRTFLEGTRIVPKRIEEVGPGDLKLPRAGRGGVPDLMAGGPPCQPFSSAGGMRSVADPRGRLFEHFVRLADRLRPRLILFENVRGLVTARGPSDEPGEALFLVKESFERIGYATRFGLLNAADYGCPQRRVRCFMVASRDRPVPEFPEATHAEVPEPSLFAPRAKWVSLGECLAALPRPQAADVIRPSDALAAALASVRDGSGLKSPGARETTRPGGHWGYKQGTFIADQSKPARTVTAASTQDWIRLPDGTLRRLTWRECAALQGFPPEWQFQGPRASQFRQIGNAVPVVLGQVIGRCLFECLKDDGGGSGPERVASAPLPAELSEAMAYTKKEQRRNGASRSRVIRLQQGSPSSALDLKGLGSEEGVAD